MRIGCVASNTDAMPMLMMVGPSLGPMMLPAILYSWLWLAVLTFRELTIPAFLQGTRAAIASFFSTDQTLQTQMPGSDAS